MNENSPLQALRQSVPDCWVPGLTKLCRPAAEHSHRGEACGTRQRGKRPILEKFNASAIKRYAQDTKARFDTGEHLRLAAGWLEKGFNVGLVPPIGVVVLDCDTPGAVAWVEKQLESLSGVPKQSRTAKGAHYWLRYDPSELPLRAKSLRFVDPDTDAECVIDLRVGGRSQAVVNPSKHSSGDHYRWSPSCGLPEAIDDTPWIPSGMQSFFASMLGGPSTAVSAGGAAGPVSVDGVGVAQAVPGHDRLLGYINRLCRYASGSKPEEARKEIREKGSRYATELYRDRADGGARLDGILREGGELDRMISSGWPRFGGAAPLAEDRTDQGYVEFVEATYGVRWLYVIERGEWIEWQEAPRGAWSTTHSELVGRAVGALHEVLFDDAAREVHGDRRDRLLVMSRQIRNNSKVESILARMKKVYGVGEASLNASPWLVTFPGDSTTDEPPVTLDLQHMKAWAPRAEDRITRVMGAPYRPGARSVAWERFLATTLPVSDPGLQAYAQRAAGLTLPGVLFEHAFFFLFGRGGTGKSTFLRSLAGAFGEYAVKADFRTFAEPARGGGAGAGIATPDIARLAGARLVVCSEIPDQIQLGARMKELTGGDTIVGRHLYGRPFEFLPQYLVWVAGNTEPNADFLDSGIWRRMKQLPVDHVHKTADARLGVTLASQESLAAICQWVLQGWVAYQEAGGLGSCMAVDEATEAFRARLDPLGDWLRDRAELRAELACSSSAAYGDYLQWMRESFGSNSREAPRVSQRQFVLSLTASGVKSRKGAKGRRMLSGIGLVGEIKA